LTFRDFNDDYFERAAEFMDETVTVNGKDVDVLIDTG